MEHAFLEKLDAMIAKVKDGLAECDAMRAMVQERVIKEDLKKVVASIINETLDSEREDGEVTDDERTIAGEAVEDTDNDDDDESASYYEDESEDEADDEVEQEVEDEADYEVEDEVEITDDLDDEYVSSDNSSVCDFCCRRR